MYYNVSFILEKNNKDFVSRLWLFCHMSAFQTIGVFHPFHSNPTGVGCYLKLEDMTWELYWFTLWVRRRTFIILNTLLLPGQ